jgi:hypothetical protein
MYQMPRKAKSISPYIQNNPESTIPGVRDVSETTPMGKREKDPEKTGYENGKGYFIPQKQIWGCGREAAKKIKLRKSFMGKLYKAIVAPIEPFQIIMMRDGKPIEIHDSIYNEPIFKPDGTMVFNPRILFNDWEAKFTITVLEDSIPEEKIDEIFTYAGLYVGIGSRRPMYGRFMVLKD